MIRENIKDEIDKIEQDRRILAFHPGWVKFAFLNKPNRDRLTYDEWHYLATVARYEPQWASNEYNKQENLAYRNGFEPIELVVKGKKNEPTN